jgi:hypothetical protein
VRADHAVTHKARSAHDHGRPIASFDPRTPVQKFPRRTQLCGPPHVAGAGNHQSGDQAEVAKSTRC